MVPPLIRKFDIMRYMGLQQRRKLRHFLDEQPPTSNGQLQQWLSRIAQFFRRSSFASSNGALASSSGKSSSKLPPLPVLPFPWRQLRHNSPPVMCFSATELEDVVTWAERTIKLSLDENWPQEELIQRTVELLYDSASNWAAIFRLDCPDPTYISFWKLIIYLVNAHGLAQQQLDESHEYFLSRQIYAKNAIDYARTMNYIGHLLHPAPSRWRKVRPTEHVLHGENELITLNRLMTPYHIGVTET